MRINFRSSIIAIMAIFAGASTLSAQDQLNQCHTVNSQVGLIVRDEPSSDGAKLGTLKYGQKVKLAGEQVEGEPLVNARISKNGNENWLKIKQPFKGWVLYFVDDDPNYSYLVPCD